MLIQIWHVVELVHIHVIVWDSVHVHVAVANWIQVHVEIAVVLNIHLRRRHHGVELVEAFTHVLDMRLSANMVDVVHRCCVSNHLVLQHLVLVVGHPLLRSILVVLLHHSHCRVMTTLDLVVHLVHVINW